MPISAGPALPRPPALPRSPLPWACSACHVPAEGSVPPEPRASTGDSHAGSGDSRTGSGDSCTWPGTAPGPGGTLRLPPAPPAPRGLEPSRTRAGAVRSRAVPNIALAAGPAGLSGPLPAAPLMMLARTSRDHPAPGPGLAPIPTHRSCLANGGARSPGRGGGEISSPRRPGRARKGGRRAEGARPAPPRSHRPRARLCHDERGRKAPPSPRWPRRLRPLLRAPAAERARPAERPPPPRPVLARRSGGGGIRTAPALALEWVELRSAVS